MAKIRFSLWEDKRTSSADAPVYLVVSHAGRRATALTGFRLPPKHWNPRTGEVRKTYGSDGEWKKVNDRLREIQTIGEGIIVEMAARGEELTAAELRDRIARAIEPEKPAADDVEERPCFLAYCDELLATWEGRWSYQTYLAYRTAVTKLREWHQDDREAGAEAGARLPFEVLTPALLRRYQAHLATDGDAREKGKRGNSANTQHKNLSTLKGFYRQAMEDGVIAWGRNPFDVLDLRKEDAIKDKLSTADLLAVRDLELDEGSLLADVRRWFLFAFYAGGMRFSDVAMVERKHVRQDESGAWRCHYRMGKTKGIHGALLIDDAMAILEHYDWKKKRPGERLFPILDGYDLSTPQAVRTSIAARNALANKYLRKIQKRAGVETRISFHLSRHSVAGYLLEQGHDILTIQAVLGHTTSRQTQHYLKGFKSSGPDDALRALKL